MENQQSPNNGRGLTQKAVANAHTKNTVKEQVPLFYEKEDGFNYSHRIANMNNRLICPRKGIIKVKSLYRTNYKESQISFCTAFDNELKIWYGVPLGVDPKTKNLIWKRFYLGDEKEYNLAIEDHAIEWAILSKQPFMDGNKSGSKPRYKKFDVDNEAESNVQRISLMKQSIGYAESMTLKDHIACVRFFGGQPENMSPIKLSSDVYELAQKNPKEFIRYWTDGNREVVDLFNAAKAVGLIAFNLQNGWLWKNSLPMGRTEPLAMKHMMDDSTFTVAVKNEVKHLDKTLAVIKHKISEADLNSGDEDSNEMIELKLKAKLLGIPAYEIMGEEELRAEVEKAEEITMEE